MARPLRIEYPGAWYHVLNRGRRRENIFFCENDYEIFFKVVEECCRLFKFEIHAYSLMPNHYHLLIHTPQGMLSRGMRHLNGVYTQNINRKYKKDGSLFKGRFKSILIEKDNYLTELVRYIHRNPHKAKLEEKIGQHRWTSHFAYMKEQRQPVWLQTEEVLMQFSKYSGEAREKLDAFVNDGEPKTLTDILDKVKWPAILGGEDFKTAIREKLRGKNIVTRDVPQYRESMAVLSAEEVINILKGEIGWKDILACKKSKQYTLKRKALAYICREHLYIPGRKLCTLLGGISYAAVSKLFCSAREEIRQKTGCYQDFKEILNLLKLKVET